MFFYNLMKDSVKFSDTCKYSTRSFFNLRTYHPYRTVNIIFIMFYHQWGVVSSYFELSVFLFHVLNLELQGRSGKMHSEFL
jgi:hypothetical protein